MRTRDELLARISDILRRAATEDAESLIKDLEMITGITPDKYQEALQANKKLKQEKEELESKLRRAKRKSQSGWW